ncbi:MULTISPECIES: SRPBCC family protein [Streptomyces]|uniref:SRPBCC family protein n=1 Tax=Streptomyces TaxID=1883 RepID=UPI00226EA19D|nr:MULTISPECIES: SRPBCC family protein [unclassified Streptomyces]MCY0940812.1 SRPBCC family protein [Streptomyces sp. H34-AA3]MCY0953616.1 SRPBCC family protein [Streptomyces sp. H27-S2]MCZ4083010.1 SRPBCC family protein [Streptomyces sp. H34-S5]
MGDYDASISVAASPTVLFSYLADVQNLPAYMPRLTSAKPHDGDRVTVTAHIEPPGEPERDVKSEAWIRVLENGKSLEWGAPGPHDYRGRLHVAAGEDEDHSRLSVELHTERIEGEQVIDGLEEALDGIRAAVEAAEAGR